MTGSRIRLARDAREVSQADLSRATGISKAVLCRTERGDRRPTRADLDRIADALNFPRRFFETDCRIAPTAGEVHFRKKSSALAGQRRRVVAELNLCSLLAHEMSQSLDISEPQIALRAGRMRDYRDSPAFAAYSTRRDLQVAPGPVRNLTSLAEAAGVFVFVFDMGEDVQGLSHWPMDRPPVVCLNSQLPGDRFRWTLAHELGHLVLHTRESDADSMEREANEFAAELLMPRDDVFSCLRGLSIAKLRDLKHDWGVAMQALIWRARDMGILSEHDARRQFMLFSKRGWRTREPEPLQPEEAKLATQMRRELARIYGGTPKLAEALGFPSDLLGRLTAVRHGPTSRHLRFIAGGPGDEEDEEVQA